MKHHGRYGRMEEHMKVVILAGGMGTRFSEETELRPKPMIEIGDKPILWHIMKGYAFFGYQDFVICCGYKGPMIKEYFINYSMYQADTTFHLGDDSVSQENSTTEPWRVTLANTGLKTLTAGRILKIKEYIGNEPFMLTYGDGVSDVDLDNLLAFHQSHGKIVTISTIRPQGRFGVVKMDEESGQIERFKEKARKDQGWVNIGFMVCNPEIFDYLGDGSEMLERGPFEKLAAEGQMMAYRHEGFWSPMDTMHDKAYLEELWHSGQAPWKTWT